MPSVIVYGPPASGKTVNAEALAEMYGCQKINDEGKSCGEFRIKEGHLNLMITPPDLRAEGWQIVSIHDALAQLSTHKAGT